MAKKRYINTRFWDDSYISELDPSEKLLFLYFMTNPATNISGVYEIPLKRVALDTGFDKDMILKMLKRFESDEKIVYKDGWVVVLNFMKHQNINSKTVQTGINENLKNAPQWAIDTVSIRYPYGSIYLNLNLDPNLNLDVDENEDICENTDISSDTKKSKKTKKTSTPPSFEDVERYAKENNLVVDYKFFFKYFTDGNWIDSKGNKVKNWKQKMLTWNQNEIKKRKQDDSTRQWKTLDDVPILPTGEWVNNE